MWTISRSPEFVEAVEHYESVLSREYRKPKDDAQVWTTFAECKNLSRLIKRIREYEASLSDPDLYPLDKAFEDGVVIPDVYEINEGPYYALYYRDVVNKTACGVLLYEKSDVLLWLKKISQKMTALWWDK